MRQTSFLLASAPVLHDENAFGLTWPAAATWLLSSCWDGSPPAEPPESPPPRILPPPKMSMSTSRMRPPMPPPTWMPPGKPPPPPPPPLPPLCTWEVSSWALSLKLICRSSGRDRGPPRSGRDHPSARGPVDVGCCTGRRDGVVPAGGGSAIGGIVGGGVDGARRLHEPRGKVLGGLDERGGPEHLEGQRGDGELAGVPLGLVGRGPQPDPAVDRLETSEAARDPSRGLVEVGPEEDVDVVAPALGEVLLQRPEGVQVLRGLEGHRRREDRPDPVDAQGALGVARL